MCDLRVCACLPLNPPGPTCPALHTLTFRPLQSPRCAAQAKANPNWRCPVCRGLCNCSAQGCLRRRRGLEFTGSLEHEARKYNYKSVRTCARCPPPPMAVLPTFCPTSSRPHGHVHASQVRAPHGRQALLRSLERVWSNSSPVGAHLLKRFKSLNLNCAVPPQVAHYLVLACLDKELLAADIDVPLHGLPLMQRVRRPAATNQEEQARCAWHGMAVGGQVLLGTWRRPWRRKCGGVKGWK